MSITLTVGPTTHNLPDDLYWADEFSWQPVEQNVERTLTGGLIVQHALRDGGQPITLRPQDESSAWMSHAVLSAIRNWAAVPGQQMTLTIRGVPYTVIFRHHDGGGIEATPVIHFNDVDGADNYVVTLRFLVL